MNVELRFYQQECIDRILELYSQQKHRLIVCLPVASGKTVIFSSLIAKLNKRALVIAHTTELLSQAKEKIEMLSDLSVGVLDGNSKEFDKQVIVASIQSAQIQANLEQLIAQDFDICIYDEAHHAAANGARRVLDELGFLTNSAKLLVGFTATAFRSDKKGLLEIFTDIAYELPTKRLIEAGFLVKPIGYKIEARLDLSGVSQSDGDFSATSLSKIVDKENYNNLVVSAYKEKADGRQAICFGTTVEHAIHLMEAFTNAGIKSAMVSGSTPREERYALLEGFKNSEFQVLCNCMIITEGTDLPICSCVIIARPTKSPILWTQMCGRGLRLYPNKKDCIVIDFSAKGFDLCSPAVLLGDATVNKKDGDEEPREVQLRTQLPGLSAKLMGYLMSWDPLSEDFQWQKQGKNYYMKGGTKDTEITLAVIEMSDGKWSVELQSPVGNQRIAYQLSFDYAFSSAEAYARSYPQLFALSNLKAQWRTLPMTPGQERAIRRFGFSKGVEKLNRSQAALIISTLIDNSKPRK